MDTDMPSSSAMEATKYSKYVSLMGVKALELSLNNEKHSNTSCNGCNCKQSLVSKAKLIENVCYACRHIIQDLVSLCKTIYLFCKQYLKPIKQI